jgi:methionyl-tRNA formyltransferase
MHGTETGRSCRLAILTRSGLEHRFVAAAILARFPDAVIVVERGSRGAGELSGKKFASWGFRRAVDKALRAVFRKAIGDSATRARTVAARLGPIIDEPAFLARATVVESVNDADAVAAVRSARCGLALVYGTGLVSRRTLESIGVPTLNLHTGLSPFYRGTACHVWPLAEGRPDRLGVTVHECVPALDAGAVLAVATLPVETLRTCDNVHAVFAELVRIGAPLYVDAAAAWLEGKAKAVPQDLSLGREYRGSELGFRSEWRSRRGLSRARRT